MLKPSGVLLVQDHVLSEDEECARLVDNFDRLRDPSHNSAYSESEWIYMFQKAGLKVGHTEQIIKRHEFLPWVERQDCTAEVIDQLVHMVKEAPQSVVDWMNPQDFGTPKAMFDDHHIIILGHAG